MPCFVFFLVLKVKRIEKQTFFFFSFFLSFFFFFLQLLKEHVWLWNSEKTESDRKSFRNRGRSQDGRGIGWGDQLLPYKFIERTFERWAKFTKQLLTASRRHQVPRKAAHHLWKEVGQNIKDKKWERRAKDGDPSWEGSLKRGFQTPGNPLTGGSGGSFWISEGNLTGRKNK